MDLRLSVRAPSLDESTEGADVEFGERVPAKVLEKQTQLFPGWIQGVFIEARFRKFRSAKSLPISLLGFSSRVAA